jgi:plasmid maintenance system antidote protein VapI
MKIEKINIGEKIFAMMEEKGVKKSELAREIGYQRQNIDSAILKKNSIDTALLIKISEALNFNFFNYYKDMGNDDDYKMTDVVLQIRIKGEKRAKMLKMALGKNAEII